MKNLDPMPCSFSFPAQKRLEMIVFGEDWGAHPSSTQHIIKRLMPDHDIVWVNSLGLRRPKFNKRDFKRACNKLRSMVFKRGNRENSKVIDTSSPHIIHPRALSWPGNPLVSLFNRHVLGKQINRVIKDNNFENPILWASMPSAIDAIDNYPKHRVVYYCGDDFRALAGVDHGPVEAMEARLAARADLIIVASKKLQDRFPAEKTVLVEHGVDYDLFAEPAPRAIDLPDHPLIAGFYGSIHDWLDLDLMKRTAQACRDWEFVFIGDVHIDVRTLQDIPNIRFLGPRSHHELPSYSQHWQASTLPFKDCEQIRSCNPLKLREYLSAGQPVISTEFPAMKPYRDRVHVMYSAEGLVSILHELEKKIFSPRKPDASMRLERWDCKATVVKNFLLSI